jgi:hypothetical protein
VAPFRGLLDSGVSQIVRRNMRRAGITAASYGSHILRHTAVSVAVKMCTKTADRRGPLWRS